MQSWGCQTRKLQSRWQTGARGESRLQSGDQQQPGGRFLLLRPFPSRHATHQARPIFRVSSFPFKKHLPSST